jgi:SAM-dependent methyltransferase
MPSASLIAHAGLPFANPMSEAAIDGAIALLPLKPGLTVLETGCGDGEILRRTVRAHPGAHGLGVDLDPDAIAQARSRPDAERIRFEVSDASTISGRYDTVVNVAASHAHGGFPDALRELSRLGTSVLYGEGFWRHAPSEEFLVALGDATVDELADLDGLHDAVAGAGFVIEHEWIAGEQDWANYEDGLAANAERHGSPESLAYARRIRDRRALPGGTSTLGFALLVLRAQMGDERSRSAT